MAASAPIQPTYGSDHTAGQRPSIRSRPPIAAGNASPRTPLVGRSLSGGFGSPAPFSRDLEEGIVYELSPRHLAAGFAGESRPRCILRFGYGVNDGRRVGDYRHLVEDNARQQLWSIEDPRWSFDFESYRADLRSLDLGLVHDRLERAVRDIHVNHLQLDQKSRRVTLVVPSMTPTRIVEIALTILFAHFTQPPAVTLFSTPIMCCVGAGLRDALVVEIGWEESVVTAIGEYKVIAERRSVRGGEVLVKAVAKYLDSEARKLKPPLERSIDLAVAEDVKERAAWCRPRPDQPGENPAGSLPHASILLYDGSSIEASLDQLSGVVESTFFPTSSTPAQDSSPDEHELSLHDLVYRTLLDLPLDLRASCVSRIVVDGQHSRIPGLKRRLLQELQHLIETRGWDRVHNYGSAKLIPPKILRERSPNVARRRAPVERHIPEVDETTKDPTLAQQQALPVQDRLHDDAFDPVTSKAERNRAKGGERLVSGVVQGVESLGAWAGASMMAHLRAKGVHEIEREDFLKHGIKDLSIGSL